MDPLTRSEKNKKWGKNYREKTGRSTVKGTRGESEWQEQLKNSRNLQFMNLRKKPKR